MEYRPTEHSYYCNMLNYNSKDETERYATWDEFLREYRDMDKDLNFIFRFDIVGSDQFYNKYPIGCEEESVQFEDGDLELHLYMMQQRKGRYCPILVEQIARKDMQSIHDFLKGCYVYILKLWKEFSD